MHILCNKINNGYNAKLNYITLNFKKKYIIVLNKLNELNYIKFFYIKNNIIYIYLKYYKNKPLIYLKCESISSKKKYLSNNYIIKKNYKLNYFNLNLYSTNKGLFDFDGLIISKIGGKFLIKVNLLDKNII
jgi:ribosomal protein S8